MDRKELLGQINLSSYVAFDFETTGLSPTKDRIIEIAAIRFVDGIISDRFVTLVNPDQSIPAMITKITGITNQMVADKPHEKEILNDLISFITYFNHIYSQNISIKVAFLHLLAILV